MKFKEELKLIQSWLTVGSLAAYNEFEFNKLYRFMQIYNLEINDTITGSENFLSEILKQAKMGVNLPQHIYD